MDPERWKQIERLCQSALEMEREKREAYLKEASAGNESLRKARPQYQNRNKITSGSTKSLNAYQLESQRRSPGVFMPRAFFELGS